MRKIYVVLMLCLAGVLHAQIGVNTLTPTTDLDVNGSVRLRKLNTDSDLYRLLVADTDGNLATVNNEKGAYQMTDVYFKTINKKITTVVKEARFETLKTPSIELGLDIEVVIEPNSMVIVSMDYNVPVVIEEVEVGKKPAYVGLTLVKESSDLNMGITEIGEGSRKFTIYGVNKEDDHVKLIAMPITGSAADVVENRTDDQIRIKYSVKGYIESGGDSIKNFGGYKDNLDDNEDFGNGIFIINVFEKALDNE